MKKRLVIGVGLGVRVGFRRLGVRVVSWVCASASDAFYFSLYGLSQNGYGFRRCVVLFQFVCLFSVGLFGFVCCVVLRCLAVGRSVVPLFCMVCCFGGWCVVHGYAPIATGLAENMPSAFPQTQKKANK